MAPTRILAIDDTTTSSDDHSWGQRFALKEHRASLRTRPDVRSQGLKRSDMGELTPPGSVCPETDELPRIILVSGDDSLMPELSRVLHPCPLEIRTLKSSLEAAQEIGRCSTAAVIFTDLRLPDGDWKQMLQMARRTPARAEVILVSRFVDVPLYLDALEAGAFDFVVPPFNTVELGYIIVNAAYACFKQATHRLSGHFANATAV